jgi:hypothetical protein
VLICVLRAFQSRRERLWAELAVHRDLEVEEGASQDPPWVGQSRPSSLCPGKPVLSLLKVVMGSDHGPHLDNIPEAGS